MKVNVSSARRRIALVAALAASSCVSTLLRSQIASARVRNPTACSTRPGIGNTTGAEPGAMITFAKRDVVEHAVFVDQLGGAGRDVEGGDGADHEFGAPQDLTERDDRVSGFDGARRGLGQQRREEQEIVGRDEQHPFLAMTQASFELARRERTAEATADDHDVVVLG